MSCANVGGEVGVTISIEEGHYQFNETSNTTNGTGIFDPQSRTLTVKALGTYILKFTADGFTFDSVTFETLLGAVQPTSFDSQEVVFTDTVTQCGGDAQTCSFILHASSPIEGFVIDPTIINNAEPSIGPGPGAGEAVIMAD